MLKLFNLQPNIFRVLMLLFCSVNMPNLAESFFVIADDSRFVMKLAGESGEWPAEPRYSSAMRNGLNGECSHAEIMSDFAKQGCRGVVGIWRW